MNAKNKAGNDLKRFLCSQITPTDIFLAHPKKEIFNSLKWIYLFTVISLLQQTFASPLQSFPFRPSNSLSVTLLLYVLFSKPLPLLVTLSWSLPISLFKCSTQKREESSSWGFINAEQSWALTSCLLQMTFLITSCWIFLAQNRLRLLTWLVLHTNPFLLCCCNSRYSLFYLCVWFFPSKLQFSALPPT